MFFMKRWFLWVRKRSDRGGNIQIQQVLVVGQVEGSRRIGQTLALFEDVGDVFAADGLEGQGVGDGVRDLLRPVHFAQYDDLLDVMRGVEPLFLESAAIDLGLRGQLEEGQQQRLSAGPFALGQQLLGVIGVEGSLPPVIGTGVSGDELLGMEEVQLVRVDLQGQLLGGIQKVPSSGWSGSERGSNSWLASGG